MPDMIQMKTCKRCGAELPSDSKHSYCENCRRETAVKIKDFALTILGMAGTACLAYGLVNSRKTSGDDEATTDVDEEEDC